MEDEIINFGADSADYAGRRAKANTLTQRVMAHPRSAEEKNRVARHDTKVALREALFGNAAEARKAARKILPSPVHRDVEAAAAIALALAGDAQEAQTLADDLQSDSRMIGWSSSTIAYQDFFTLWRDADPGIPILREAKSEFSKLQ